MSATGTQKAAFGMWRAMRWSEDALIPASRVLICWAYDAGRDVMTDVLVTDFPNDQEYFADHWFGTSGACYRDWLELGKPTMTPESVFGELAGAYGFANKAVAEKTIVMFARIKECDWARKMLASDSYDKIAKAGLIEHW